MEKQKVDKIITEYFRKIYGFAMNKAYSYDEAEELCAEILKEVYISLRKADEIANVEGYIWRIGEHTYARYVSQKKKNRAVSIDDEIIPYFEDKFDDDSEYEINRLRREIAFLTEKRRKIVFNFYYENKSVSTIAREMLLSDGTVKWHLNRAKYEIKESLSMERKIGKLGLNPIETADFGHSGTPEDRGGPEVYLEDKLNLNIVYSVYHTPRTREEIAEELGITPVFIDDRITMLENNGFLVKTKNNKYTTYVIFSPEEYSLELIDDELKSEHKIAEILEKEYVPQVRKAVESMTDVYIPSGNRELLEAAAIYLGIIFTGGISTNRDLSKYQIKTLGGGDYTAFVYLNAQPIDPDYERTFQDQKPYSASVMTRGSFKYPVESISVGSVLDSRAGGWENNLLTDYEYLYEVITDKISNVPANSEKFSRLKKIKYITDDNKPNIMIAKGRLNDFIEKLPRVSDELKNKFVDIALESAMQKTKFYPPQMHDYVVGHTVSTFINNAVAIMLMDILYGNGTFKPLTENEKIAANLIMFCDTLPTAE